MDQNSLESGLHTKETELFVHERVWFENKTSIKHISHPIFAFLRSFFPVFLFLVRSFPQSNVVRVGRTDCCSASPGPEGAMSSPNDRVVQRKMITEKRVLIK